MVFEVSADVLLRVSGGGEVKELRSEVTFFSVGNSVKSVYTTYCRKLKYAQRANQPPHALTR
jgi:hypothetical protein